MNYTDSSHPQQQKQPNDREHCRAAWRIFIPARRFTLTKAKITHRWMNRLEGMHVPLGGFWAEPRKHEK